MGDVVQFQPRPGKKRKKKGEGLTLCKSGFHKWAVDQTRKFDVKQGKLVTLRRCERCGATKITAD